MEKVTKKDFYKAIMSLVDQIPAEDYVDGVTSEMISTFCENEIGHLEKKTAKAKERAAEKKAEADPLSAAVEAALVTDEFKSIPTIAADVALAHPDVTASKVSYRLTQLIKSGVAEKQEITVPSAEGGKARKVQGYRLIAIEE